MVYKEDRHDQEDAYILEGYRRLYWNSVDEDLYRADFDRKMIETKLTGKKLLYEDYYCQSRTQTQIMKKLVDEEYITERNVRHKLKSYEKDRVNFNCTLGAAPMSCLRTFLKTRSETKEKIKHYLTEVEMKELDED